MNELPDGLHEFLTDAGWHDAAIDPMPGDASFRRYFRVAKFREDRDGGSTRAMLMYAPPPHEDPAPFLHVARWLGANRLRAPEILAADEAKGWVLTEDFGDDRMREWLDAHPQDEDTAYRAAIDALVELHRLPAGPFGAYDLATYRREAYLFTEWYTRHAGIDADADSYAASWDEALVPLLDRQQPGITVLRDYHAENIMLPHDPAHEAADPARQGLIDFQDALVGHPAYDLVSLLQDARRDVSEDLESRMLAYYTAQAAPDAGFADDYAILGAQRNAKIIGIFTRLSVRDGKKRYLEMIPRVWAALERDLANPALAPVARWFDENIPQSVRAANGRQAA
ncbi:hypothetical protein HME9302_00853 [Alteripontixanthobacter maritimus]|uniref:Aminoglycoside phosphotransferase domain-containing protein n=1 Tax=Alteripontixanthobacter maritimus TaxID=2161824 RepID=A0A369Q5A6_9SPHN|nr:phosphotransferase [Alteripontixanthobacter maritimus]RDC59662.1 hypothetical protein HME9302_00853 [Alteripontixanthobacter maritimus]